MSTIYSSTYLKNLAKNKLLSESKRIFSAKDQIYSDFDIFLSHSFLDRDEVEGLYLELTRMGFSVYVDWIIDPNLDRTNVTKTSATIIRNRLKSSKTLLIAISVNATISKWMPWELGYIDGHTNKCAIIPVSKAIIPETSYKGIEYLSLYPFVKKAPSDKQEEILWVIEEIDKYIAFSEWLNGQIPYKRNIKIL